MILALPQCQKEINELPADVRDDLIDALAKLNEGNMLSMPLSRPTPSVGNGVHELRFRDRNGIYRVIYVFVGGGLIYLLHAFIKKPKAHPSKT